MNSLLIAWYKPRISGFAFSIWIKAILSFETNVEDEVILEKVYEFYFNEDGVTLLDEELKERIQHEKQVLSKNQKEL